jgi:hypothetical protein
MGVRRSQYDGVGQTVKIEIVEIGTVSGQKPQILAPLEPVANAGTPFSHALPAFLRLAFAATCSRNTHPVQTII